MTDVTQADGDGRIQASIVIVTYGQRDMTDRCLRSLEHALGDRLGSSWEIVVVDNNSADDTPELLRSWSDRATVRLLDHNRNFAGGCNLGASLARGEVLVFLNNDTEVPPGAMERLAEQTLEPGVGAAGCRMLYPNGTIQHAGVAFMRGEAFNGTALGRHIFRDQDEDLAATQACFELDCVTGACLSVRADLFRELGGFDEMYRNGMEDVDLCLRIRMDGHLIVYRGDVTIMHHEGASRGRGANLHSTPERAQAMNERMSLFVGRWAHLLHQDDELAEQVWDAALEDHPPERLSDNPGDLLLIGQPSGLGPAADEARAWLLALASAGVKPVALNLPHPDVVARLTGPIVPLLDQAQRRLPVAGSPVLLIPTGASDHLDHAANAIVRLARPGTAVPLNQVASIWACSPPVAQALAATGVPQHLIKVIPPVVLAAAPGTGAQGVLAILPTHDPSLVSSILSGLRGLDGNPPIRLLPTAHDRRLEAEVSEHLPAAELLAPCSDEHRFTQLASTADVVLAIDSSDHFERRALVAAGTGTPVLSANPDGPAAFVLGDGVLTDVDGLDRKLAALLAEPMNRGTVRQTVLEACSIGALSQLLSA